MKSWIVKIRCSADKKHLWVGNISAVGRNEAKRAARLFVSEHFPLDTQIIAIAEGRIDVTFSGPEIPFDEPCEATA